jgi:hypothetical protein
MKRFHTMGWCILALVGVGFGIVCTVRGLLIQMPWCGHTLIVVAGIFDVAGGIYVLHSQACVRLVEPLLPDIHYRREDTSAVDRRTNKRDRRKLHHRRALYNMVGKNSCKEPNNDSGYEVLVSQGVG